MWPAWTATDRVSWARQSRVCAGWKRGITLDGHNITNRRPLKIREEGLAHIPEDRNDRGLNKSPYLCRQYAGG